MMNMLADRIERMTEECCAFKMSFTGMVWENVTAIYKTSFRLPPPFHFIVTTVRNYHY